ncbi:MAG TPA: M15 family metallopeptidase [Candidatus Saccharimonadales bacterium]|nr:M15 family metallopeptidase [Candidatus Saccharimonadales bacterium]
MFKSVKSFFKKQNFIQASVILLPILVIGGAFLTLEKDTKALDSYKINLRPQPQKTTHSRVEPISTVAASLRIEEKILGTKAAVSSLVTDKGDDLLVLVNKKISLPASYAPRDLISITGFIAAPSDSVLRRDTAVALSGLKNAAKAQGANLSIVSAYRSYSQQVATFNGWVNSAGLKSAESFSARPGHSQHQLGTTVDFGVEGRTDFSESFATTTEGSWLSQNAYKYGFVLSYPKGREVTTGYSYEPWHYRYIGVENAQKMISSGKILEEYLQEFGTW